MGGPDRRRKGDCGRTEAAEQDQRRGRSNLFRKVSTSPANMGGPYPLPTRFLYSSKHAADTHNKPLIKACFGPGLKRPKLPYGAGYVCVCMRVCVRETDRDRECMRASELHK